MKRTSDVLLKELKDRSEQILDVSLPASSDSALSHLRLADTLYRHIIINNRAPFYNYKHSL